MENHEILRYIVDLTGIESRAFHRGTPARSSRLVCDDRRRDNRLYDRHP